MAERAAYNTVSAEVSANMFRLELTPTKCQLAVTVDSAIKYALLEAGCSLSCHLQEFNAASVHRDYQSTPLVKNGTENYLVPQYYYRKSIY